MLKWVVGMCSGAAGWVLCGQHLCCRHERSGLAVTSGRVEAVARTSSGEHEWRGHVDLRDFLIQRAIQTQLFYMLSTRDGPKASWLARFLEHEHLDSTHKAERVAAIGEGGVGEGGDPFTYRARFGGLRVSHDEYLRTLMSAPTEIVQVEIAPSRARLSTMERNNPFLAKQKLASFFYDETIEPKQFASRIASTAIAIVDAWLPELERQAQTDDDRVYADSLPLRAINGAKDRAGKFLEAFADDIDADENMPLFDHDKRAIERWTTLRAAHALLEDLSHDALSALNDDIDLVPEYDTNVLVGSARRRAREAAALGMEEAALRPRAKLKAEATLAYFAAFADEWCPRLVHGADDKEHALLGKAPPGLPRRQQFRAPGQGQADADEALEHLTMDRVPIERPGGYLVSPRHLATNLRAYRASFAYSVIPTLTDFRTRLLDFASTRAASALY